MGGDELTIVLANHRIGAELRDAPKATGGQPYQRGSTSDIKSQVATQAEMVGYGKKASRLKKLADIPKVVVKATITAIHRAAEAATAVPAGRWQTGFSLSRKTR
jgi:hypothetical protein